MDLNISMFRNGRLQHSISSAVLTISKSSGFGSMLKDLININLEICFTM